MPKSYIAPALLSFALSMGLVTSPNAQSMIENPPTPAPPHEKQDPAVEKNLKVFDTLDFDVFSNQKWDRLKESHALRDMDRRHRCNVWHIYKTHAHA